MSKFYAQGNISDDSDSEEEQKNMNIDKNNRKKFDVDDDDHFTEEKGRVIHTESEKKKALFKKLSSAAISAAYIKDFDKASEALDEMLLEVTTKSKTFIEKEGIPSSFLRALKTLDEETKKITGEEKKKLKNTKGLNIIKQKLKKNLLDYQDQIDVLKEEETESEKSESQSSASSSDESEEEEHYKKFLDSDDPHIRRKYWLKREKEDSDDDEDDKKEKKEEEKEKKRKQSQPDKPKYHLAQVKKKQETIIASAKEAETKIAKIHKEFTKLNSAERRQEYLETLNSILKQSEEYKDFERVSLLLFDVPIRLEVTRQVTKQIGETHFSRNSWNKIFSNIVEIFKLLRESEDEDLMGKIAIFGDNSDQATLGISEKQIYTQIRTFINGLERELLRSFDYLENSEAEYSERLQDLVKFVELLYRVSKELAFKEELEQEAAQIAFKVVENMYFMSTSFIDRVKQSDQSLEFTELADEQTLETYAKQILKLNNKDYSIKTLLYLTYNHAINRRSKGKDLLVMTDISESIHTRDYYTQICFNRTLVQLGISAFHQGNLYETQQILSFICSLGKSREENKESIGRFLGQAQSGQKQAFKHKVLPYYLHFNVDLVEAVQLIASMVLQIPFTLLEGGKITSRSFKKVAYQYQRSHFISEPLNYKDLVYAASQELKRGNVNQCFEKLAEIDIWSEIGNKEQTLQNLKLNIKDAALKCYIYANRDCFRSISLDGLCRKFDMELKKVRKLVFREINEKRIVGNITSDGYLTLLSGHRRKQQQSGIRSISINLFSKLEELSKNNEQIFKQRQDMGVEEEQEVEREAAGANKLHEVMREKLKNIMSRRGV